MVYSADSFLTTAVTAPPLIYFSFGDCEVGLSLCYSGNIILSIPIGIGKHKALCQHNR